MKFVCDSCHAQYMISDDKVGANGVKVRCKKCSNIIVVKKAQEAAEATMVMQNPLANAQANGPDALFGGVGMDEIGQAFDNVLSNSGPQKRLDQGDEPTVGAGMPTQGEMPMAASGTGGGEDLGDRESTRVMDLKSMAGLAAASAEPTSLNAIPDAIKAQGFVDNKQNGELNGHANGQNGTNGAGVVPQNDWYVAVDDEQKGPMTLDAVKGYWEQGKVTPDSLVWRTGYADWKPLSTISDLVKVLTPIPAPRKAPEKKPEEAPAGATASGPQLPASVTPAPMAVPDPDEVDWKPSAASALASLVADEMEALSKPAPKLRAEPVGVGESTNAAVPRPLLSVEPPSAPQPETPITMNRLISAANADMPASEPKPVSQPEIIVRPPPPAAAAPSPYASAYPSAPEVPVYPAPAAYVPPAAGNQNTKYFIIGGAVLVGCLTLITIVYFIFGRAPVAVQQPQLALNTNTPRPVEVAPAQPVAQPKPAQPVAAQPAPQPAAQPAAQPAVAQPAAQPKVEEPPPEPPKAAPNETASQKKDRYEKWKAAHEAALEAKKQAADAKKAAREQAREQAQAAKAEKAAEKQASNASSDDLLSAGGGSKVDKDFDKLLGGGGASADDSPPPPKKHSGGGYIPPSIDQNLPAQLGQGDIMGVVAGHKSQIVGCINQQRSKDPDSSGTVKMHWVIQRNGSTSGVSVGSDEFKGAPIGKCMSGIIRGWKFPQFSGAPMPIDFPFRF